MQAAFLAALILGSRCPCFADAAVRSARFQARQAGYATDDLVVTAEDSLGRRRRLLLQVKHNLSFTKSDDEFGESLRAAWSDFRAPGRIDPDLDRIAIVTGPASSRNLNEGRTVLAWARTSADAATFVGKVEARKFSSEGKRNFLGTVRSHLAAAADPPADDGEVWRFLRVLHLLEYDFDTPNGRDETAVKAMLDLGGSPAGSAVPGRWERLVDVALILNQAGGDATREVLGAHLPASDLVPAVPVASGGGLAKLRERSWAVLERAQARLPGGRVLRREALVSEVLDLLEQNRLVVLHGEPGAGKSALAKLAMEAVGRDAELFALSAADLGHPGLHHALAALGIHETLDSLAARLALLRRRVLLVDAAEKLLEGRGLDAAAELLRLAARDAGWRVILTCRDQGVSELLELLIPSSGFAADGRAVLRVPFLDAAEMRDAFRFSPRLLELSARPAWESVLRVPLYASLALGHTRSADRREGEADLTPAQIRRILWDGAVRRPEDRAAAMPARREQTFVELAKRRARAMRPLAATDGMDAEALAALAADGLVEQPSPGLAAPMHDLLEDVALQKFLGEALCASGGDPADFAARVGDEPALRRACRLWLRDALGADPAAAALVEDAIRDPRVPPHWRDELIVSALQSGAAPALFAAAPAHFLVQDAALLDRVLRLLRVACKEPNAALLEALPEGARAARVEFGLHALRPSGPGWEACIAFVHQNRSRLGARWRPLLEALLSEWSSGLDHSAVPGHASRQALEMVLGMLAEEEREEHWAHRDLRSRLVEVALRLAHAGPALIRDRFSGIVWQPERRPDVRRRGIGHRPPARFLDDTDAAFVEKAMGTTSCVALARFLPDVVREVVDRFVLDDRPAAERMHEWNIEVGPAFGIAPSWDHGHFPESPLQGPWYALLRFHWPDAVDWIVDFSNRAAAAYAESGLDGPAEHATITTDDGGSRTLVGGSRLWGLYRGLGVGPHLLVSALMALDQAVLERAAAGEDLAEIVRRILERSTSVATLAPLAGWAAAHASLVGDAAVPLLTAYEFFEYDQERAGGETSSLSMVDSFGELPGDPIARLHWGARRRLHGLTNRSLSLESYALALQFTPNRGRVLPVLDRLAQQLDNPANERARMRRRFILARVDSRRYRAEGSLPDGRQIIAPMIDDPAMQDAAAASARQLERMNLLASLHQWADGVYTGATPSVAPFPTWREALAAARGLAEDEEADRIPGWSFLPTAYVAAVVLRDHDAEMSEDERRWCVDQLTRAVEEDADTDDTTKVVARGMRTGAHAAAGVLPVLIGSSSESAALQGRRLVAIALTHSVRMVRAHAVAGVRARLWAIDHSLAEHCAVVLLSVAQALGNLDSMPDVTWEERREAARQILMQTRGRIRGTLEENLDGFVARRLADYRGEDLVLALSAIPATEARRRLPAFVASLVGDLVAAEERRGRHREARLDYQIEQDLAGYYAEFLLSQADGAADLARPPLAAIASCSDMAPRLMEAIVTAQDGRSEAAAFWAVWRACAAAVAALPASTSAWQEERHQPKVKITRMLLLADIPWKAEAKEWAGLNANRAFVAESIAMFGASPSGFAACVSLLRSVGAFALPGALQDLDAALRRAALPTDFSESRLRYDLEVVMRGCLVGAGEEIRARLPLRRAAIHLLDRLVEGGSSPAYLLRDYTVAPWPVGSAATQVSGPGTRPA